MSTKSKVKINLLKEISEGKKEWKIEDEKYFLSPAKITFLNHPAKNKAIFGAKDSGKTFPICLRILGNMETQEKANALCGRKYKLNASSKFQATFSNIRAKLINKGYDIPTYKLTNLQKTFRMDLRKQKEEYQSIDYFSLDDPDSISGIEASGVGYFTDNFIDEPVLIGDRGETPTKEQWKSYVETMKDSVNRSRRVHLKYYPENEEIASQTTNWYAFNIWDKRHPLVEDANRIIPDEEFLKYILGIRTLGVLNVEYINTHWKSLWENIKKNSWMMRYNQSTDFLYCKTTKFANPDAYEELLKQEKLFKDALIRKDSFDMARLLGLTYQGKEQLQKALDLRLIKKQDNWSVLLDKENGWKMDTFSIGWDIDINEALEANLIVLAHREIEIGQIEEKIFVMPTLTIPAFGVGGVGDWNTPYYEQAIINETFNLIHSTLRKFLMTQTKYEIRINIDDNHASWIKNIDKQLAEKLKRTMRYPPKNVLVDRASKHRKIDKLGKYIIDNSWDRRTRLSVEQLFIDHKYIIFDASNEELINNLDSMVLKTTRERDESGWRAKMYNKINAFEYALHPYRNRINRKGGT